MPEIFHVCNFLEHANLDRTVLWLLWHEDFILKNSKNLNCPAENY